MRTLLSKNLHWLLTLLAIPFLLALAPGEMAPEFSAKNQDGKIVKLSELKGSPVLLFFYPKDDTPGCTKEACAFRDSYSRFRKVGAVVYGVSLQDEKSHHKFRAKHKLPFDLLVDEEGKIAEAFEIGRIPVFGLLKRQSILIGRDGRIAKIYRDVSPESHAEEVMKDIEALK